MKWLKIIALVKCLFMSLPTKVTDLGFYGTVPENVKENQGLADVLLQE